MQEQDIQSLADAFIERAQECNVKLFPETAEGFAKEIFEEWQKDPLTPIESLVKEKFNQICGKKSDASISRSFIRISSAINFLLRAMAQAAASGPLTPQEIEEWRQRIIDNVYVPFQNIGLETAAKARELMLSLENLSKGSYSLEQTYKAKVTQTNTAFADMASADKAQQASPSYRTEQEYKAKRKKYLTTKDELIGIAEKMTAQKGKMNTTQAMLIYLTGTSDYIKDTVKVPENFGTRLDGGSSYLKEMKIKLEDIKTIISAIKTGKSRIDIATMPIEGPERHPFPEWMMRSLGNNPTVFAQEASIGPSVDSLDEAYFDKNTWTSFGQKNILWEKVLVQNPGMPHAEQQKIYQKQIDELKPKNKALFGKINALPNTWKKFREVYEILDPQSPKQARELYSASAETPESWMAEETKIQGAAITQQEIEAQKVATEYLNKKNPRAWGLLRKISEIQNPKAHWSILYVLSNLNEIKYSTESGKTYGEEFIDNLPADKKDDPLMLSIAQKIDGLLSDKRRELALQVILNKNVPDWILMKMASIGYRAAGASDQVQKERDEAYDFIRKVAYEMLQTRGWKLKRDKTGAPISHTFGPHEVGFEFEKTTPVTASSFSNIKTADSAALGQFESQMKGLDQQITSMQQQLAQKQAQKGQLQKQMAAEQERQGQLQKANEQAKAQQAMSDAAQPASNQAPAAGVGTSAMGGV